MKISRPLAPLYISLTVVLAACSTGQKKGENLAANGPTIVSARANPATIQLDRDYQARTSSEILAEVKDFTQAVTQVRIKFINAPLDIPMELVSGTTWRAILTPEQIKTLAVGNQTTQYEVNIIATNAGGATVVSENLVRIVVQGPRISKDQG